METGRHRTIEGDQRQFAAPCLPALVQRKPLDLDALAREMASRDEALRQVAREMASRDEALRQVAREMGRKQTVLRALTHLYSGPAPVYNDSPPVAPAPVCPAPVQTPSKGNPGRPPEWTRERLEEAIIKTMIERLGRSKPITQRWIASTVLDRSTGTLQYHLGRHALSYIDLKRQAKTEAQKRQLIDP